MSVENKPSQDKLEVPDASTEQISPESKNVIEMLKDDLEEKWNSLSEKKKELAKKVIAGSVAVGFITSSCLCVGAATLTYKNINEQLNSTPVTETTFETEYPSYEELKIEAPKSVEEEPMPYGYEKVIEGVEEGSLSVTFYQGVNTRSAEISNLYVNEEGELALQEPYLAHYYGGNEVAQLNAIVRHVDASGEDRGASVNGMTITERDSGNTIYTVFTEEETLRQYFGLDEPSSRYGGKEGGEWSVEQEIQFHMDGTRFWTENTP